MGSRPLPTRQAWWASSNSRSSRPREVPLLRAVLSAERAVRLDWWSSASLDPREALDTWWVEGELVAMGASP